MLLTDQFDTLIASLAPSYVSAWPAGRLEGVRAAMSGERAPTEEQVTSVLAACEGVLSAALLRIFLDAAGMRDRPVDDLKILGLSEYNRHHTHRSTKAPDLIVTTREFLPVLVIEAKFRAMVNGAWGYCWQRPDEYSNQVICYQEGCWTEEGSLANAGFVWIAREATVNHKYQVGPWGRGGLHAGDIKEGKHSEDVRVRLIDAFARQCAVQDVWKPLTWELVVDKLEGTPEQQALATFLRMAL